MDPGAGTRVIRASTLGFCMGVRRAVELARAEILGGGDIEKGPVYTLGPLIHNPQVLAELEALGVRVLEEGEMPEALEKMEKMEKNCRVILRAHGVSPELEALLVKKEEKDKKVKKIDATCPRVKASQLKARALTEAGFLLFVAGERDHGEIAGIRGYAPGCVVAANPLEAAEAAAAAQDEMRKTGKIKKTALLGQTTISPGEYRAIEKVLREKFPDLTVVNSLCGATRARQESLKELCRQVEAVVVAGGRASANTRRLAAIAGEMRKPAWVVERPEDLPPEVFGYHTVGLSAGASTPPSLVDAIEAHLCSEGN